MTTELSYRQFSIGAPRSIDREARTAVAVIATDAPVEMGDGPEHLHMPGLGMPEGRQVPLLDSHSRFSTRNVLGSVRNLRIEGGELVGDLHFADARSFELVEGGHLTDLSAGYRVLRRRRLEDGETATIDGRTYTGPATVAEQWAIKEASLTPIGADSGAKVRSEGHHIMKISDSLTTKLIERGMPADTTDVETWLDSNMDTLAQRAIEADRKFRESVRTKCAEHSLSRDDADAIASSCATMSEVSEAILDTIKARSTRIDTIGAPGIDDYHDRSRISFGRDATDKFAATMSTALSMRALSTLPKDVQERALPKAERPHGWEQFRHISLDAIATEILEREGVRDARYLSKDERARSVMLNGGGFLAIRGSSAFHTTGSFPNLVLSVLNKSLFGGYMEAEPTWRTVFRTGTPVPDFKNIHRIRMSEAPNLDVWDGHSMPAEVAFTDERENYAVESYSDIASFSYKLIVNDDMDALSRVPISFGRAAARTVNAAVWKLVIDNPTMTDGQALFSDITGNRLTDNLTGSGAAPTVAELGTAKALMRLQRGINKLDGTASDSILNVVPRHLVVPASLETSAQQTIRSTYDPASNTFMVENPFNGLTLSVEPILDGDSTTAWYLFADANTIDTIEVTFLQGQETPVINPWIENGTMAYKWQVLQSFGVKALDFRGAYKNVGT